MNELHFDFSTDMAGRRGEVRAVDDKLGIEDDVRTMCRLVAAKSTKPPLAIGLFGDWGTGKTFFINRMQSRIREMQIDVKSRLDAGEQSPYCEEVDQVTFNAWHFVDANLWASLITRIFDVLAGDGTPKPDRQELFEALISTRQSLKTAQEERRQSNDRLEQLQARIQRLTAILDPPGADHFYKQKVSDVFDRFRKIEQELGDSNALPDKDLMAAVKDLELDSLFKLIRDTRSAWGFARSVTAGLTIKDWIWLSILPLIFVVMAIYAQTWFGGWKSIWSTLTAAGLWLIPWVKKIHQIIKQTNNAKKIVAGLERRRTRLESNRTKLKVEIESADERVKEAQNRIDDVRKGNRVRRFIRDHVTRDKYREQLGLISLIRKDLEKLSSILVPEERTGFNQFVVPRVSRLQRIVLYIDDLDRCPPDRVVEVLQAVHLLLAFPLFVVVVAVDPRWLLSSLEVYYRKMLQREDGTSNELDEWAATPTDYLEKIFQIPFALSPMDDTGYKRLINALAPVRREEYGEAAFNDSSKGNGAHDENSEDSTASSEEVETHDNFTENSLNDSASEQLMKNPNQIYSFDTPGKPLGIWFAVEGRRLVIASDQGFWLLDRGSTTLRRVVEGSILEFCVGHDLEHIAWRQAGELHCMDLATGERRWMDARGGERCISPGIYSNDLILGFEDGKIEWHGDSVATAQLSAPIDAIEVIRNPELTDLLIAGTADKLHIFTFPNLEHTDQLESVDAYAISEPYTLVTSSENGITDYTLASNGKLLEENKATLPGSNDSEVYTQLAATGFEIWAVGNKNRLHAWRMQNNKGLIYRQADLPVPVSNISYTRKALEIVAWNNTALVVQPRWINEEENRGPEQLIEDETIANACLSPTGALLATQSEDKCKLWRVKDETDMEIADRLELDSGEVQFLATLGPLIPTARNAKRLVNLYRWLRASRNGRAKLANPKDKEYEVVLLILALVVGWPKLALTVLDILEETRTKSWQAMLKQVDKKQQANQRNVADKSQLSPLPGRLNQEHLDPLKSLSELSKKTPADIKRYKYWAPIIRRFSILTRPSSPTYDGTKSQTGKKPTTRERENKAAAS